MNTFLKIALGFILGVLCTVGIIFIIGKFKNSEENQLREEIRTQALNNLKKTLDGYDADGSAEKNIQSFELTTKKGIVNLHTYMPKDSVKALMGRPQSTDVDNYGYKDEVRETWRYRGSNNYIDEFTIEFTNGKLKSVRQYKEH
jgi:hypothetical protein